MRTLRQILIAVGLVTVAALWAPEPAQAQTLGIFRWQLLPFDEIVSFAVVQRAADLFDLSGIDSSTVGGSASYGIAFLNADGTIGLGYTTVRPDGTTFHVSATIAATTLAGTWRIKGGESGQFVPRP